MSLGPGRSATWLAWTLFTWNAMIDVDVLIAELGMHQRRKVVRALLAGNDAQCFTVDMYAQAYHRIAHNNDSDHKNNWIKWLTKLAPQHLRSVGMVEVNPGIWAKP